jgi:hypothetical protein
LNPETNPLWVVTSYYNPAGYRRRLSNFQAFRRNLKAPLVVVELAKEGEHQLRHEHGDKVIQLTGDSHIWQKERLLNIAIASLPRYVKYVAWIDCDVAFERNDWVEQAISKLEKNGGVLQLFETVIHCPKDYDPNGDKSFLSVNTKDLFSEISGASIAAQGKYKVPENTFARELADQNVAITDNSAESPGHGWAARVSDLRKVGIYDANIIGGGDSIFFHCATGTLDSFLKERYCSSFHESHIRTWKEQADAAGLFDKITFLEGKLFHFWHGKFTDRHYRLRHKIPFDANFDPQSDIKLASNQTWQWTNPEGNLAQQVRNYFKSRQEDGSP